MLRPPSPRCPLRRAVLLTVLLLLATVLVLFLLLAGRPAPRVLPAFPASIVRDVSAARSAPAPWPRPVSLTPGPSRVYVDPASLAVDHPDTADLRAAVARFRAAAFPHGAVNVTGDHVVCSLTIRVDALADGAFPALESDESYSILVELDAVAVSAKEVFGVYRALDTLAQLVQYDFVDEAYFIDGAPVAVRDAPLFPHRELMLDAAAHFLPVPVIKRIVDAMAHLKLNVLHWSLVGSEAFPLLLPNSVWFVGNGSFSSSELYGRKEYAEVIEYCRQRGIRVVPEIALPSKSWCRGDPEMCMEHCYGILNYTSAHTRKALRSVFDDIAGMFPDKFVHVGMNSVPNLCWQDKSSVQTFLNNVYLDLNALGKTMVVWDGVIAAGFMPPEDVVVQVAQLESGNVTQMNNRVIRSPEKYSLLSDRKLQYEAMMDSKANPCDGFGSADECHNKVLGGGAVEWSNEIDGAGLESVLLPRLAVVSERLWSGIDDTTKNRYPKEKCRMMAMGFAMSSIKGSGAGGPPEGPGDCTQ